MMRALDLFSAAAGGWTLGLHRAGFLTVAACEIVPCAASSTRRTIPMPVTYGWMMGYPPGWLTRALRSAMDAGRLPPA